MTSLLSRLSSSDHRLYPSLYYALKKHTTSMAFTGPPFHTSFLSRLPRRLSSRPLRLNRPSHSHRTVCSTTSPTVGFIGLGVMGLPMAANLASSFPDLLVWNRTDKSEPLNTAIANTSAKARVAKTPADVIAGSQVTFSMLSTPEAVCDVFFEGPGAAINGITAGKGLVDCSTLQISDMLRTEKEVVSKGGAFLEAPVSGSKGPAEQGQLIFLCAGDQPLFSSDTVQTALSLMGKKSFYLGEVGNGTKMKLVVNQLMGTMLAALGESIVLTEALNLSVLDLLEVLYVLTVPHRDRNDRPHVNRSLGAMNNPMFALKGPKMKHGVKGYDTNFPLEHAQKDIRFAQALGDDNGISMGVSSAANEWYKAAKGLGLGREDFAAVIESIRASAGRS